MIKFSTFASNIEDLLNTNAAGIVFKVFTDAGKYKRALKTHTEKKRYTNAILRIGSSSVIPTQGLYIATQSATLEVTVQLLNSQTDEQVIESHRAVLDALSQTCNVVSMKDDGKEYAVSTVYSQATTGELQLRDTAGTSITFYVNIDYSYIENGLNSFNCKFTLDGYPIPYTTAKIVKSPQTQADAFSDSNGRALGINYAFTRSFDFLVPAQALKENDTGLGAIVLNELAGNDLNAAHTLVVDWGGKRIDTYEVVFGESDISLEGINNAGQHFALFERAF